MDELQIEYVKKSLISTNPEPIKLIFFSMILAVSSIGINNYLETHFCDFTSL